MNLQHNIRYDTLTSKKLSFVEYGGELFRPVVHPETGDTVFIDGVLLPLPKENTVTAFDTIHPCELKPLGDTRLTSEFIEVPNKLNDVPSEPTMDMMCNAALIPIVSLVFAFYLVRSYSCWVEFVTKLKVAISSDSNIGINT